LTERLEELAGFLDSLLSEKVLWAGDKQQAIKQAVSRSRELSRQLSLSLNETSMASETSRYANQSAVIGRLREQLSILSDKVCEKII